MPNMLQIETLWQCSTQQATRQTRVEHGRNGRALNPAIRSGGDSGVFHKKQSELR